jgi:WD40 repeat protein
VQIDRAIASSNIGSIDPLFSIDNMSIDNWQSELQLAWQGQLNDLVTTLTCAPDGRGWAASSAAGEVVWNRGLGELIVLQSPVGDGVDAISQMAFSADGRWLAAGGQAGKLAIWNCDRSDDELPPQLATTLNIDEWVEHLVWHPTEPYLAVSYGAQVQVWDVLTSTKTTAWKFDRSSVFDLAWHPGGEYIAAAGDRGVQIWSAIEPTAPSDNLAVDTTSLKLAWSADGSYLAVGNLDRTLTMIDWQQPDERWTLQGCPGKIRQLAWLNGTDLPSLGVASGETIVLWALSTDATTWNGLSLSGHQDIVTTTIAHPIAPIFATGGADGYACLWTVDGQIEQIFTLPIVSGITAINWHPQALYLAAGTRTGAIGVWTIPA